MPSIPRVAPLALASLALSVVAPAQTIPINKANWRLANRYSAEALGPFTYSVGLTPNWINNGDLMLVHSDMDNNVHYAGTFRLMSALMRANKRFDLIVVPGKPRSYGDLTGYVQQRMFEYFAEHLLGDRYGVGVADLLDHG